MSWKGSERRNSVQARAISSAAITAEQIVSASCRRLAACGFSIALSVGDACGVLDKPSPPGVAVTGVGDVSRKGRGGCSGKSLRGPASDVDADGIERGADRC